MAPNPRRVDARLAELYARVPPVACKGLCHGACCFVQASGRESQLLDQATGRKLGTVDAAAPGGAGTQRDRHGRLLARYRCTMLTDHGTCGAYAQRPMICRLYGVAEGMECEHGCQPERLLSVEETLELLQDSLIAGGRPTGAVPQSGGQLRAALEGDQELRATFVRGMRKMRADANEKLAGRTVGP